MADQDVQIADEMGCGSNCYYCFATETTCYVPSGLPEFCGTVGSSYNGICCNRSNHSMCIMKGHQAFEDLSDGDEKTCCIILQVQDNCVKPMWLDGTEPIFKSVRKGGCTTQRCSFPLDDDAPGRCSICGCIYLGCEGTSGCCPKIPGLPPQAFTGAGGNGYETDYKQVVTGPKYLCCAVPCEAFSLYIPAKMVDAFGCEMDGSYCCFQSKFVGEVFPELDGPEHETILIQKQGKLKCVEPTTCVNLKARVGFTFVNIAIPPTPDAPCGLAICGFPVCGIDETYQAPYLARRVKPRSGGMAMQEDVDSEKMDRA